MPDYKDDIKRRAANAQAWMFDAAFPFWAARARHADLGFLEALDLHGDPVPADTSRVRVQARQTYCFALAEQLGWQPDAASELSLYGVDILTQNCRRDDGLYGRDFAHTGGLSDATAELYDSAFARLAFAAVLATGRNEAAAPLRESALAIETLLKRPGTAQGYAERLPPPESRNQNPHMHLYESSLAHYAATLEPQWSAHAHALEDLMASRFLVPDDRGLRERFAADWGPHVEDHFEAGHQYEWVWLLHYRARLDGRAAHPQVDKLYKNALDLTGPQGEVWLKQSLGGDLIDGTQRSWGLTEALKAHIVWAEAGDEAATKRCIESYDRLWALHIAPAIEGGWIDAYDHSDTAISQSIPASIGYHIYLAYAELMRFAAHL